MADPFVAEIRMFAGNFAPKSWALCNGQIMPISQNTALFALLGTFYGGDGQSTFALPNMLNSAPMHQGQGPGLTTRVLGETGGTQFVTLIQTEIPVHTHQMSGGFTQADLTSGSPTGVFTRSTPGSAYQTTSNSSLTTMNAQMIAVAGASLPHTNMQPYLAVTFIIALQGVFPARP